VSYRDGTIHDQKQRNRRQHQANRSVRRHRPQREGSEADAKREDRKADRKRSATHQLRLRILWQRFLQDRHQLMRNLIGEVESSLPQKDTKGT